MAKVKLAVHKNTGPLLLRRGGETYALTAVEETYVPLGIALGFLGDSGIIVKFDSEDKPEIVKLPEFALDVLREEFSIEGDAKKIRDTMYPSKKKSFIPKLIKDVEEVLVVEEPVVEEPVEELTDDGDAPLDIEWGELTVKELKNTLEEKGLSTEGRKADLVARLTEAK